MNDDLKGLLLGFVAVSMFGLTLPVTRLISPHLDPIFIGLGRAALAAMVAVFILAFYKARLPTSAQFFGFWLIGGAGSALVIIYSLLQGGGTFLIGDVSLFAAVVSAAFGYAVGGKLSKELAGWQVICWALVISFPLIITPALYYAPEDLSKIELGTVIGFLYLVLASQLFGFFIWYKAMAIGGVARVSQVQLLQPFVTLLVSAWALSEAIGHQTYTFAIIVVALVAIGKRMPVYSAH